MLDLLFPRELAYFRRFGLSGFTAESLTWSTISDRTVSFVLPKGSLSFSLCTFRESPTLDNSKEFNLTWVIVTLRAIVSAVRYASLWET
jgi:hypothetical protein